MAAALGIVFVAAGVTAGSGSAAATETRLVLDYACIFPFIDVQPLEATVIANLPAQVVQGTRLDETRLQFRLKLGADVRSMMEILKAATIEGDVVADIRIGPVGEPLSSPGWYKILPMPVPPPGTGEIEMVVNGHFPALAFPRVGDIPITVHDLTLDLTMRKADGGIIPLPNEGESPCTQDPGQNALLTTIRVNPHGDPPPLPPTDLRTTSVTTDTVSLAWEPSVSPIPTTPGYEVFIGDERVASVPGLSATVSGLQPDTEYVFSVKAIDSARSAPLVVRTSARFLRPTYEISGSTAVKAANTSVPLSGVAVAEFDVVTEAFTADLSLRPVSAAMQLFGAFPATAQVGFTPAGKVTGVWADGGLTAAADVGITLSKLTVLGFPIAVAPCQTGTPAAIGLRSAPGFSPATGGTLTGTYAIPSFTGCWPFASVVTSNVSGPGNTVDVRLRAQPA